MPDFLDPQQQDQRSPWLDDTHQAGAATASFGLGPLTNIFHKRRYNLHNQDSALDPLMDAYNDKSLTQEKRAQLMLDYRDDQMVSADLDAVKKIQGNDPNMPVYGGGDKKGMHVPLFEKLGDNPKMQAMMADLAQRINDPKLEADKIDINKIFADTQAKAASLGDGEKKQPDKDSNLLALQAMATLMNAYKFDEKGMPKELAEKLPPGMFDNINTALKKLNASKSADGSVMSHGKAPAFDAATNTRGTADHNFHFFSHAYLTASLMREHGMSPEKARAMSGMIGAQYELLDYSLAEGQGNSGIHDIFMNAEGAQFGTDLMKDPKKALPGKYEGADVEDRSIPDLDLNSTKTDEISKDAQDLSKTNLAKHGAKGLLHRAPKQFGPTPTPLGLLGGLFDRMF